MANLWLFCQQPRIGIGGIRKDARHINSELSRKLYILIITIYLLDLPLPVSADTGRLDYLGFFFIWKEQLYLLMVGILIQYY